MTTALAKPHVAHSACTRRLMAPLAIGLSISLHVGAFVCMYAAPNPKPVVHPSIDIEVISVPPIKRIATPPAPVPRPLAPRAARTPRPKVQPAALPSPVAPQPPTQAYKAAPMHIGLSLSSTTSAGAMAVPIGDTLAGAAAELAQDPNAAHAKVAAGADDGAGMVQSFALTQAPEVDGEPDLRAYYPADAAREAIEGQVVLQLSVDATGKVTRATISKSAGHGFDEAAIKAALQQLHFKPAQHDGQAVATQIFYTLTFLLD